MATKVNFFCTYTFFFVPLQVNSKEKEDSADKLNQ